MRVTSPAQSARRRHLRMAGDTIVEVLICILLISMVLGGAYTTVRRSTTGIRNSQEHAEALKRLEAQVEQIRTNASSATPTVYTTNTPFCMIDGTLVSTTRQPEAAQCTQDGSGKPATDQPAYKLSATRTDSNGGHLITVRANWDSVTGVPAEETIFYRLQQ